MMKQRIWVKMATIFEAQDLSQIEDLYGMSKKNALLDNLNNQFCGRVASYPTAQYVVNLWGKAYVKSESMSESKSRAQASVSKSQRLHERSRVTVQEVLSLEAGEFLGQLVESSVSSFKAKICVQGRREGVPLPAFRKIDAPLIRENFSRIRREVKALLEKKEARPGQDRPYASTLESKAGGSSESESLDF